MSTNYYMKTSTSQADDDGLHLGKRSAGWRFTFKGDKDLKVVSFENWKDMVVKFRSQGFRVYDEYGVEQDLPAFFRMVENWHKDGNSNTQWCKDNYHDDGNVWTDEDGNDFIDGEFC